MTTLQVHLLQRDFAEFPVPLSLQFTVKRLSRHGIGGPRGATISATGDLIAMGQLLRCERCPVDLYDERGRWVWGGYISKIAARNGVAEETISIDEMANSIRVAYTTPKVGSSGGGGRATTNTATNAESIEEYGTKQLLISNGNQSRAQAEGRRDQELAQRGMPLRGVKLPFGFPNQLTAELTCKGWGETFAWIYYTDTTGYESYETVAAEVPIKIGQAAFTSSGIRFDGSTMYLGVEHHEVDTDDIIKLGHAGITGTDIGFEDLDNDRIYKTGGGLAFIKGDEVTVTGAAEPDNNNTFDVIDTIAGTHLVLQQDIDTEGTGSSITLTPLSHNGGIGQSFTTIGGVLKQIRLKCRKAGSVPDGLTISVYADSSGEPGGGALATLTLGGAFVPESMDWGEWDFTGGPTLSAALYWLVVDRSGAVAPSSAYALALDKGATYSRGECLVNVGGWVTPSFGACDLIFEVITEPTSNFQAFVAGDIVTVSGSGSNNATYTLSSAAPYALSIEGDFITEEAGASVTLTPYGGGSCQQTYSLGDNTAWSAGEVRIPLYKVGTPSDNLQLTLRDNSDTLLATATIPATNIGTGKSWIIFSLGSLVPHIYATTYKLRIARTGSTSSQHAYVLLADEGAAYSRGALQIWNGSSYVNRSPPADLNFIVVGFRTLLTQVVDMITAAGQFISGIDNDASTTLYSNPYRDGDSTALDEIEGLLLDGAGGRILMDVGEGRRVHLYNEPTTTEIVIRANGTLETRLGERIPKHMAPVGVWAELKDILPSGEPTTVFIEGWDYDVQGDRLTPTIRGERDMWDVGGVRQG